jgi:hypothetical protein
MGLGGGKGHVPTLGTFTGELSNPWTTPFSGILAVALSNFKTGETGQRGNGRMGAGELTSAGRLFIVRS